MVLGANHRRSVLLKDKDPLQALVQVQDNLQLEGSTGVVRQSKLLTISRHMAVAFADHRLKLSICCRVGLPSALLGQYRSSARQKMCTVVERRGCDGPNVVQLRFE